MADTLNLLDIPDLSEVSTDRPQTEPLADGWYEGQFLGKREFTDKNGNDRVFESSDTPAQSAGRNIRLQIELTRRSDGKKFNVGSLVHYRNEDLTPETIQAVLNARKAFQEDGTQLGELFRASMTLSRLGKLQKIAGIRQFQRTTDGGLDITPLFGKKCFFRLKPDSRNPQFKEVADYQDVEPKRVPVL